MAQEEIDQSPKAIQEEVPRSGSVMANSPDAGQERQVCHLPWQGSARRSNTGGEAGSVVDVDAPAVSAEVGADDLAEQDDVVPEARPDGPPHDGLHLRLVVVAKLRAEAAVAKPRPCGRGGRTRSPLPSLFLWPPLVLPFSLLLISLFSHTYPTSCRSRRPSCSSGEDGGPGRIRVDLDGMDPFPADLAWRRPDLARLRASGAMALLEVPVQQERETEVRGDREEGGKGRGGGEAGAPVAGRGGGVGSPARWLWARGELGQEEAAGGGAVQFGLDF